MTENRPRPLTPRQRRAVYLVSLGATLDAVAEDVGIAPRTLRQWRALPAFREALEAREAELREQHARMVAALVAPAVAILRRDITTIPDSAPVGDRRLRQSAARTVLEIARLGHRLDLEIAEAEGANAADRVMAAVAAARKRAAGELDDGPSPGAAEVLGRP